MSILAWIMLALIAGFIGSKVLSKARQGILTDIVLVIVGALVGGWLFNTFGASGVTWLNFYSLLVAAILLVSYHAILRAI